MGQLLVGCHCDNSALQQDCTILIHNFERFHLLKFVHIIKMICKKMGSILLVLSLVLTPTYPAPQTSPSTSSGGLGDLFRAGSSLALGFLNLLGNQDLRDQVGQTVSTGVDLTGQFARVALPLVQTLTEEENQKRFRDLAGSGLRLAQGFGSVASQASQGIGQGSRLAGSVIKAANDTAPLVIDGIQEFTDTLPLITEFASAYAEVNAEQAQEVVRTFQTSLQENLGQP